MVKEYETDDLIIYWKPDICQHSGECTKGNLEVFDAGRRPWVMPEKGETKEIMEVIDRCPSGALSYKLKKEI
ncbi:MAG: (4Fe-4S)-binding protein [Finegoldia sp.]|nr:(4Fe-4S)-binding protein [Finegoldia sp.]